MKSPKPHPLPKKLRDEIAALATQIRESAKALDAARDNFKKARAASKSAKIAARTARRTVKVTKKRLASLGDALSRAEKKAAKWKRKHVRKAKPSRRKTGQADAVSTK